LHDEGRVFDIFLWLILELIEAKITGCFDLLDEESKLPTPRAEHFTSEVHNRNKGHPRLDVKEEIL
jgi:myosin heavy subunit